MPIYFKFFFIFLYNITIPFILYQRQSEPPSLELLILYGKFRIKTTLLEPYNESILTSINLNQPFNILKLNSIHHSIPYNLTRISLLNNITIPVSQHNSFIELKSTSNILLPFSFYNTETSTTLYQQEPPGISFAYTFTPISFNNSSIIKQQLNTT